MGDTPRQDEAASSFDELKEFVEGRVNTVEALEEQRKGPPGRAPSHLQGLPLADPDFTDGTQIDVLLGATSIP